MTAPKQTCQLCGNSVEVSVYMRGFPPETAKTQLKRLCASQGCACRPKYVAGGEKKELSDAMNGSAGSY